MGASELHSAGEAWEMRFKHLQIATETEPPHETAKLGRIASAMRDAFELLGCDGVIFPFLDRWQ